MEFKQLCDYVPGEAAHGPCSCLLWCPWSAFLVVCELELEFELIQTQMAQKPMLRAEVYAHAMRASQNRKKEVRREKEA